MSVFCEKVYVAVKSMGFFVSGLDVDTMHMVFIICKLFSWYRMIKTYEITYKLFSVEYDVGVACLTK